MNSTSSNQQHSIISITLLYAPTTDIRLWIMSHKRYNTTLVDCHAAAIARQLRSHIEPRLQTAHIHWCGMEYEGEPFIAEPITFVSDPEGIRDAVLSIPIPKCFSTNWDRLHTLVHSEAARIARMKNGRLFTVHECTPDPAQ